MRCANHNRKVNIYANGDVIHVSRFITDPHHLTLCNTNVTTSGGRVFTSTLVTKNGRTFREWTVKD